MKTAAVVIDDWKLPVFEKHFKDARLIYTQQAGITKDTLTLMVEYRFVGDIKPIIDAANQECSKTDSAIFFTK